MNEQTMHGTTSLTLNANRIPSDISKIYLHDYMQNVAVCQNTLRAAAVHFMRVMRTTARFRKTRFLLGCALLEIVESRSFRCLCEDPSTILSLLAKFQASGSSL